MKIVIDMPEEMRTALEQGSFGAKYNIYDLAGCVMNGTPLPKGHGRLIYAEDVKQNHRRWIGYLDGDMIARLNIAIDKYVPTIIEEDRGSLEWLSKNCKDCGNEKCKKLGGLPKGYDCALWQAKQEDNEDDENEGGAGRQMKTEDAIYFLGQLTTLLGDPRYVQALKEAIKVLGEEGSVIDRVLEMLDKEIDLHKQLGKPDNQHRDVINALKDFRRSIVKLKEEGQE